MAACNKISSAKWVWSDNLYLQSPLCVRLLQTRFRSYNRYTTYNKYNYNAIDVFDLMLCWKVVGLWNVSFFNCDSV